VKVLVLNCGSSSVKFQLVETDEASASEGRDRALAKGIVENIGGAAAIRFEAEGRRPLRETQEVLEHKLAVEGCLELLTRPGVGVLQDRREIEAVGHRVVHGGERFKSSALIDDDVLAGIEECFELAPLHNPPNVKGYRAARDLLPSRNDAVRGAEGEISPAGAGPRIFVVPTNEEILIARDTMRLASGRPPA